MSEKYTQLLGEIRDLLAWMKADTLEQRALEDEARGQEIARQEQFARETAEMVLGENMRLAHESAERIKKAHREEYEEHLRLYHGGLSAEHKAEVPN